MSGFLYSVQRDTCYGVKNHVFALNRLEEMLGQIIL